MARGVGVGVGGGEAGGWLAVAEELLAREIGPQSLGWVLRFCPQQRQMGAVGPCDASRVGKIHGKLVSGAVSERLHVIEKDELVLCLHVGFLRGARRRERRQLGPQFIDRIRVGI